MNDRLVHRASILAAYDEALTRWAEVMQVVYESEDDDEAVRGVRRLLDCDDAAAQAVLDLSWRRLCRQQRADMSEFRREVVKELEADRPGASGR